MERVLQVIGGLNRAGAETMLMNLYRQLDKQKIQFDFLIYKPGKQDYEDEIIAAGGRVLRISAGGITSPLQYIFKIMYVIRKYGPYKAIHIHTLHNGAWALLAALPFRETVRVMHSHNTANPKHGVVGRLYNTLTKFLIRICAEKCVACGNDSGEYLFGKRFHHEGIVIRNGIDVNKFRGSARDAKMAFCSRNHFAPDAMLITCIGRLHPVKNHSFAIKIAEELKRRGEKFLLVIAGDGDLKTQLEQQIIDTGLDSQVKLLGNCSEIPLLLMATDVFLMPSLFEGLPVTLIEAQASGLPCLTSNTITQEADMGLGLFFQLDLEAGVPRWADELLSIRNRKNTDFDRIRTMLQKKGYDVSQNVTLLLNLYKKAHR